MPDIFDQVAPTSASTVRGRHVGDIFDQISSTSDSIGLGDVLRAGGEGLMSLVGGLAPAFNADPTGFAGQQAVDAGRRVANYYATSPGNVAPQRAAISALPVIGPAAADIAAPALAYGSGRPPTRAENLDAIRSGTATAAGLAAPAIVSRVGAARAGTAPAADTTTPATDTAPALDPAALTRLQRSLPGAGIDPATGANAARALAQYQKISGGAIKSLSDVPDAVSTALDQATAWKARNPDVADPQLDQYITDLQHAQKSIVPIVRQQLAPKPGFAEHPIQTAVDTLAAPARAIIKGGVEPLVGKAIVNKLIPDAPQVIDNFTAPFGKRLNAAAANVPVTDRLTSLPQSVPGQSAAGLPDIYGGGEAPTAGSTTQQTVPSPVPVSPSNVGGVDVESLGGTPLAHEDGLQALPDLTDYVEPGAKQIPIPRRINRKTAQLEIGGETVGKRVPYEQQLPDPTSTIEAARMKAEQQLQRQFATTTIARDTMQSKSFPQWALDDQREFGKALNQGDPGTAAAVASRAEQQAAGIADPAFGAINHLPDIDLPELYNGNGIYIDPTGKITQIKPDSGQVGPSFKPDDATTVHMPQRDWGRAPNADYLEAAPPKAVLPSRFKTARSADMASPRYVGALDSPEKSGIFQESRPGGADSSTQGVHWLGYYSPPSAGPAWHGQTPDTPAIALSRTAGDKWTQVLYHELGHAAWDDLTPAEQDAFQQHYAALTNSKTYDENSRTEQILRDSKLQDNGTGEEYFPEVFSLYVNDPQTYKTEDPAGYKLMRKLFGGREYLGVGGSQTKRN